MVMRRGEWWSAYGAVPMRVDLCTMRMEEIYPEVTTLHRRTRHWVVFGEWGGTLVRPMDDKIADKLGKTLEKAKGEDAGEEQKRRAAERTEEPGVPQRDETAVATQRHDIVPRQPEAAAPEARPTASDKDPTGTKQICIQSSFQYLEVMLALIR